MRNNDSDSSDKTEKKFKRKDEEPAQQGQKPLQPAVITAFIPNRKRDELITSSSFFLLKIILIYQNVCTVLKTILTCKLDAADHFTK